MDKKQYNAEWYQKNKERIKQHRLKRYALIKDTKNAKNREKWKEDPNFRRMKLDVGIKLRRRKRHNLMKLLGGIKCSNCGYEDWRALEIDHIHGGGATDREKFPHRETMILYYLNHAQEAKEKLQVLCANCHKIKTFENKEYN